MITNDRELSEEALLLAYKGQPVIEKRFEQLKTEFEVGAVHAWYDDPWARGAFALFEPEQQTRLQDAIVAPEGRIHFAGKQMRRDIGWRSLGTTSRRG